MPYASATVPTPKATLSSRPIIASTNSARSGSAKPYGYSRARVAPAAGGVEIAPGTAR